MSKRTTAEAAYERLTANWNAERASYAETVNAVAQNRQFSAEYKQRKIAELNDARRQKMLELAPKRMSAAQEVAAAVRAERQELEQTFESQYSPERLQWYARELGAQMAALSDPGEIEDLKTTVYQTGDANKIRAFRTVAAETVAAKFASASSQDTRRWANTFAHQLDRDRGADVPAELRTARDDEGGMTFFLNSVRSDILSEHVAIHGRPPGFLERNDFADAVGELNPYQVVINDRSVARRGNVEFLGIADT